jgi:SUMO ligase MMS21 Smc5/6 complex component
VNLTLEAISYHGGWAVKRSRDLIKSNCDASSHIVLKQSVNDGNNVFVDPKKALELIETQGTDEKRGDKYLFVLHPEVTNFFVLLHDFTDSYFSVSSFDDQVFEKYVHKCKGTSGLGNYLQKCFSNSCPDFSAAENFHHVSQVKTTNH